MTPKDKANQLMEKYYDITGMYSKVKQICIQVVEDILESHQDSENNILTKEEYKSQECTSDSNYESIKFVKFWEKVKKELQKL